MGWHADDGNVVVSTGHDPMLLPDLPATDAAEADRLLAELLGSRVRHVIEQVVRRVMRAHATRDAPRLGTDREDLTSDAVARMLGRLRALRARTQH